MAEDDKPLYYDDNGAKTPAYYGKGPAYYGKGPAYYGKGPAYYGKGPSYYGKSPAYYGKGPSYYGKNPAYYGAGQQYGSYGAPSYGGQGGGESEGNSVVGALSVGRMLRVVSQRWLSVFVFVLVGAVISFAIFRISPTIYQTQSEFTMDLHRLTGGRGSAIAEYSSNFEGSSFGEIFNTRLSDWRGDRVVNMIVQRYRANYPASTVSESDIIGTIRGASIALQRGTRIITITVRSGDPELAASVANAYAEAIEEFTDEENKIRCDKAVQRIHENVEKKRSEVDKIAKQLLDFRSANKVDNLRSLKDTLSQSFSKATGDILSMETEERCLVEYEKLLAAVQKEPETFITLSANVPKAEEIASLYRAFEDANSGYQGMLQSYTDKHPEVKARKAALDTARKRFIDGATRALLSCQTALQVVRNQLADTRTKQEVLRGELGDVEQRIVLAESGLGQLEAEFGVANRVLEGLILDENKARLEAENNNEIVRVGRPAGVPKSPILPNAMMIFGAGLAVSAALGLLFVLVLDNLEDTVVNLSDIEGRLALKVLAVLPHVRRKRREQVAHFVIDEKYSHFSESVAALRNLLDSPRYESLSHCMLIISTQPGEGKTITSCSLASAYAQAGKRTLLADFDMRRPRQAKVWELQLEKDRSFSHAMQAATESGTTPDFAKLVNKSKVDGLDVIASLPPEGVSPATIFGSSVVGDFFEWARAHYDRVIIDSPPFGLVGDVVSLATLVDSSIIMCCPDRTHFKPIQYCSASLTEAGANILGVIVNDVEVSSASAFSHSHHHRGSYSSGYGGYGYGGYGYGYGYGYSPKEKQQEKQQKKGVEQPKSADKPKVQAEPAQNDDLTDDE